MDVDDANTTTTKLLTLLNVSASRLGKRKHILDEINTPVKLNKRKQPAVVDENKENENVSPQKTAENVEEFNPDDAKIDEDAIVDSYDTHFGPVDSQQSENSRNSVDEGKWKKTDGRNALGKWLEFSPETPSAEKNDGANKYNIVKQIEEEYKSYQAGLPKELLALQKDFLQVLGSYKDIFVTRMTLQRRGVLRDTASLHILNHILKKRRQILKNNERLSKAAKDDTQPSCQDQGFTRPSVLVLLPFRSFALRWLTSLIARIPKAAYQVENHARFVTEYSLPDGAVDKLETAPPGTYPPDHIEMFKGNIDDSFRVGVKLTRKSMKLFSDFYQCDLVLASPLGLRLSIEKEKNADFLSSIEIVVVDQLDALTMQNWEHLQYVFSNLNLIPKETRDADFSRIKPWFLDGLAKYFRQTILLSPYETPEMRSLFNKALKNISGKIRTLESWPPVQVPQGITQTFIPFDCPSHNAEADKRFEHFSTKLLPSVLKSAVQSANTVIFVPSSFDFIRVRNHLRKHPDVSFAVLSEYSSNQDISRARQAFFSGSKPFLLVSERFHFFRRYKIRGIRNIVFYGLPDHPQFYTEFLSFPFIDEGVEPEDVTCRALICKYDWMKLERIAGTAEATRLIKSDYA